MSYYFTSEDMIPRRALQEKIERIKELERALELIRLMAEEDIRIGQEGVFTHQIEAAAREALEQHD